MPGCPTAGSYGHVIRFSLWCVEPAISTCGSEPPQQYCFHRRQPLPGPPPRKVDGHPSSAQLTIAVHRTMPAAWKDLPGIFNPPALEMARALSNKALVQSSRCFVHSVLDGDSRSEEFASTPARHQSRARDQRSSSLSCPMPTVRDCRRKRRTGTQSFVVRRRLINTLNPTRALQTELFFSAQTFEIARQRL